MCASIYIDLIYNTNRLYYNIIVMIINFTFLLHKFTSFLFYESKNQMIFVSIFKFKIGFMKNLMKLQLKADFSLSFSKTQKTYLYDCRFILYKKYFAPIKRISKNNFLEYFQTYHIITKKNNLYNNIVIINNNAALICTYTSSFSYILLHLHNIFDGYKRYCFVYVYISILLFFG